MHLELAVIVFLAVTFFVLISWLSKRGQRSRYNGHSQFVEHHRAASHTLDQHQHHRPG
jgi:hypothetical protein